MTSLFSFTSQVFYIFYENEETSDKGVKSGLDLQRYIHEEVDNWLSLQWYIQEQVVNCVSLQYFIPSHCIIPPVISPRMFCVCNATHFRLEVGQLDPNTLQVFLKVFNFDVFDALDTRNVWSIKRLICAI